MSIYKIEERQGPEILQEYFEYQNKNGRNPLLLKTLKTTAKISYQLPNHHIAKSWNSLIQDPDTKDMATYRSIYQSTELYAKGLRTVLIEKYNDKCNISNCFICKKIYNS